MMHKIVNIVDIRNVYNMLISITHLEHLSIIAHAYNRNVRKQGVKIPGDLSQTSSAYLTWKVADQ